MTDSADAKRPLRGAAAAQAGFDYQLDVSILAALQLLLISKAATRLVLEPASEEDLEADLEPYVPGRLQPSAIIAGGYKLVVQVKMDNGEPWSIEDFDALLKHGSAKRGGAEKPCIISTSRTLAICSSPMPTQKASRVDCWSKASKRSRTRQAFRRACTPH
ncbi:hypothetical protein [Brevundimonas sp. 2P05AA]|uniref:hypothetical protein n=1 Tax=Brevundimonas TaxID=41275 RepID=UPI00399F2596